MNSSTTSGLASVGTLSWGTHLCHFYSTAGDLVEALTPYFAAGLTNHEACLWITDDPLTADEARAALVRAVRKADQYIETGQMQIIDRRAWDTLAENARGSPFDAWVEREEWALRRGLSGLRIASNVGQRGEAWDVFAQRESSLHEALYLHRILAVCSYAQPQCGVDRMFEIMNQHSFALLRGDDAFSAVGAAAALISPMQKERSMRSTDPASAAAPMPSAVRLPAVFGPSSMRKLGKRTHAVRFYEGVEDLSDLVAAYASAGLQEGNAVLVIATEEHRDAFFRALVEQGTDAAALREQGRIIYLDAHATLDAIMIDDLPDEHLFSEVVGARVTEARARFLGVRAYGEMVDVLWKEGKIGAAQKLEHLWDQQIEVAPFSLLCAYDLAGFEADAEQLDFHRVCSAHTHVFPASRGEHLDDDDRHNRVVAELQQTSRALTKAVQHRGRVENERAQLFDSERLARMKLEVIADRLTQLQRITSALSESVTTLDIAGVVSGPMAGVVGASRAFLAVPRDGAALMLLRAAAHDDPGERRDQVAPERSPIAIAWRHATPIWLRSAREVAAHSPSCEGEAAPQAVACLPIIVGSRKLGAIGFEFPEMRDFSANERALVEDLAKQTGLAFERSHLYEIAQRAIEKRDDFLSVASHELKTPLTTLHLLFQSLLRLAEKGEAIDSSVALTRLNKVNGALGKLTAQIDELLDVSRISNGRMVLRLAETDLTELVTDVASRFSDEAQSQESVLRVATPRPVVGRWDRERLDQVITNLLSNALKYGMAKPIEISVAEAGPRVILEVADGGIGISPVDQARIFEKFERAASVRHYGGLGLGLWIAREIVSAHGGSIFVKSAVGSGSTFVVDLPRRAMLAPIER